MRGFLLLVRIVFSTSNCGGYMYIQVTNRCNMTCAHCCYSCTEKGHDMTMAIYRHCVNVASEYGETVSIGGGEPTLHPKILEMIAYAITKADQDNNPWISTNGTNKTVCEFMMKLAKSGLLGLQFSLDEFHDVYMIDEYLFDRIIKDGYDKYDLRHNWTVRRDAIRIANAGRAKQLNNYEKEDYCSCPDIEIKPTGNVHWCGCEDAPSIGSYKDLEKILEIRHEYLNGSETFDCWFKMNEFEQKNFIRRLK